MGREGILLDSFIFSIVSLSICALLVYLDMRYNKSRFSKTLDKGLNCSVVKRKR